VQQHNPAADHPTPTAAEVAKAESEELQKAAELGLMLLKQNEGLENVSKALRHENESLKEELRTLRDEYHFREEHKDMQEDMQRSSSKQQSREKAHRQHETVQHMEERIRELEHDLADMTQKHSEMDSKKREVLRHSSNQESQVVTLENEIRKLTGEEEQLSKTVTDQQVELEKAWRKLDDQAAKQNVEKSGFDKTARAMILTETIEEMLLLMHESGKGCDPEVVASALELFKEMPVLLTSDR